MKVLGVIPARWASTRLPGKPLLDLCGKPVIQHVYERCCRSRSLDAVVVATDDDRIAQAVEAFGGQAVMTSPDHPNGTSRVAQVAEGFDCSWVVNVQGDEPLIDPGWIDRLVETLEETSAPCATLAVPLSAQEAQDPNAVKVVLALDGKALYFSRSAIPYGRCGTPTLLRHLGIYGYRRDFLPVYLALAPTPLSLTESLEQLRILEQGYQIAVAVVEASAPVVGIDVMEDLERARVILAGSEEP